VIVVLSNTNDVHADAVEERLRSRGAAFVRFDPREAGTTPIALEHDGRARLGTIDLDDISAVWLRRPGAPQAGPDVEDAMRRYVALELDLVIDGIWESLDCAWLPGRYPEIRRADHKLGQLRLAGELGFVVPPSLITNDARALVDFFEAHGGAVIGKLASPAVFWTEPRVAVRYTQIVTLADLGYATSTLRHAPMLFQKRIDKALEIRVTVVGDRVFAAEIDTQRNARTAVDSRNDFSGTHYDVHALPASIEARCRTLTRRSGLSYSTIDLIVTPQGDYVFLELNPNGQYLWIEQRTGLPISDAIAEMLITHEVRHGQCSCHAS
jgi:hypothetical protein